jgi:hypothetical protein
MIVTLHYRDGGSITLPAVEAIRLVAPDVVAARVGVEIKTFGNEPAINRGIARFEASYDMPPSQPEPTHPRTGEPTNAARAARVEHAIRAYAESVYGLPADRDDDDTVLQDFLTDVFHFAASQQLDVEDVSERAVRMFIEEREQEAQP